MSAFASSWKRIFAVFKARNLEFFRDKGSLSWSLLMPILIITAISAAFSGDGKSQYKVGVMHSMPESSQTSPALGAQELKANISNKIAFFDIKHIEFVEYKELAVAQEKVQRHALDMLVDWQNKQYWLNQTSPKGYLVEQLLLGHDSNYEREVLIGREIRYLDWLIPGILGMNIMFGSLFGASYVIVRYRKNSVLKRLKATPLKATEFIFAQVLSRVFVVITMASIVFALCNFVFDFYMLGSYFDLLAIGLLGALCMISLGLLMACRSHSEELIGGLINLLTWPMMLLSGVWFSLEGASELVQNISQFFPLTHMLNGARAIMTDGATLADLRFEVSLLLVLTIVFITLTGFFFKWEGDNR